MKSLLGNKSDCTQEPGCVDPKHVPGQVWHMRRKTNNSNNLQENLEASRTEPLLAGARNGFKDNEVLTIPYICEG